MIEIFQDINEDVKRVAELSWNLALAKNNVLESVKFLDNITNYYRIFGTPEEVEFLQFYFNMKMEMMKQ